MKKGFTLVEVIIAISIFVFVTTVASNILINFSILEKKTNIQNVIYEDIRIIITQLSNLIESGTIDYEEYYSMNVIQNNNDTKYYGLYNGIYSSRFHSPGLSGEDLGTICSNEDCSFILPATIDTPTGQNPFDAIDEASAFCDETISESPVNCDDGLNNVSELYLIDKTGSKKTIIGRKLIAKLEPADPAPEPTDHYALAILEMAGKDYDQNGIVDLFSCTKDFNCEADVSVLEKYPFVDEGNYYNIKLAKQGDLEVVFDIDTSQFIPISPLRINITDLSFTINPIENPYLAYNERDKLYHPSVAISITVDLSEQEALNYPGKFEPITFKTTISAGVVGEIVSYPPVKDFYQEDESSWINDVFSND